MISTKNDLREEVKHLAEEAFHHKLISGYGDGPKNDEFQIVCDGKPKHFRLEYARFLLNQLLRSRFD